MSRNSDYVQFIDLADLAFKTNNCIKSFSGVEHNFCMHHNSFDIQYHVFISNYIEKYKNVLSISKSHLNFINSLLDTVNTLRLCNSRIKKIRFSVYKNKNKILELISILNRKIDYLCDLNMSQIRYIQAFHLNADASDIANAQHIQKYSIHEICRCINICYIIDSENIKNCGICFSENTPGIKPECCGCKQNICLDCLKRFVIQQFRNISTVCKESTQDTTNDINVILSAFHFSCCYCRNISCYKKYIYLLNGN